MALEQTGTERQNTVATGAESHGISTDTEARLRAAMDAQEFEHEDDWLAPPRSGVGFYVYCPIRFIAYLERFGPAIGEGTPPKLPSWADDPVPPREWLYTYFAKGKVTGRIKIGLSRQPEYRISQLQHTTYGESSEPLVILRGNREKMYHRVFSRWLEGNEWFAPHPDIIAEIGRLNEEK